MKIPNFFIAGASKSGTGWLKQCLSEHPEVFIPKGPNPNYFSRNYEKGKEWYLSFFESATDEKKVGEKSTSYIIHENSANRMHRFNPKASVYFVLRDPIERAYSHYKMLLRAGEVSEDVDNVLNNKSPLVREGLYYRHISRFMSHFGSDRVNVLFFKDLKESKKRFVQNLYRKLGVESDFVPEMVKYKYNTTKNRPRFQKAYNGMVSFIQWIQRKSPKVWEIVKYLRKKGYTKVFHYLNRGEPFPEISGKRRNELKKFYQKDIKNLEKLLNVKVSHWC